ncbi:MAG: hypothetical protein KJ579_04760 [Verrucomicrobia bacterium]|nr:hypothetical protein [Verrucomicrobiota bacterium]
MSEDPVPYTTAADLRKPEGYFYRRKKGRHLNVDTGPKDAEIYYCVKAHGKRYAACMHTTSLAVARRRAARFPRGIALGSLELWLHGLVRLGQSAQRELDARIDAPRRRR